MINEAVLMAVWLVWTELQFMRENVLSDEEYGKCHRAVSRMIRNASKAADLNAYGHTRFGHDYQKVPLWLLTHIWEAKKVLRYRHTRRYATKLTRGFA